CAWVAGDSGASLAVVEDDAQAAKLAAVRDELPGLRAVLRIDGDLDGLRERGRARDPQEVAHRSAAVGPQDPYTIIYTSGTTGPPKGCVLSHGNYRQMVTMAASKRALGQ